MFTGIVTDIGTVAFRDGQRFGIASRYAPESLVMGASIACDGCCLTVVRLSEAQGAGSLFEVDVSNETASRTTLASWQEGTRINLERSLALGDELGGHLVQGHVDGTARIVEGRQDGDSVRFVLEAPADLAGFIAPKGAVALNGVSLTINSANGARFDVNLIPYTLSQTTWGDRKPHDLVNLEVDLLARYVQRLASERFASLRRSEGVA
jgi:riboflavin synthase